MVFTRKSLKTILFLGVFIPAAVSLVPGIANASSASILYSFQGSADGNGPDSGLLAGPGGVFYGTTLLGGNLRCGVGEGCGTVYQFSKDPSGKWIQTVLFAFNNRNGWSPESRLIIDAKGNLYGTTALGGANGNGAVYKLSPPVVKGGRWIETVLYSFRAPPDGVVPASSLHMDANGHLFGTTKQGGTGSYGTVFELTPPFSVSGSAWTEKIIYNFTGGTDGGEPLAGLIPVTKGVLNPNEPPGTLYGTTVLGGNLSCSNAGCGVVFKLAPPVVKGGKWTETVLHAFNGRTADGSIPESGLYMDASGNLFGTTANGGSAPTSCSPNNGGANGCGTAFELAPSAIKGGAWTESILHSFGAQAGDGTFPSASFIADASGAFYGTALNGGSAPCGIPLAEGCGTVFKLSKSSGGQWTELTLYNFKGSANGNDGADPFASVVLGANGLLYGTTNEGGSGSGPNCSTTVGQKIVFGCGTIFSLAR